MSTGLIIILGVGFLLLIIFISSFNNLKTKKNQIQNAVSSLDALFIKRSDLIPNLIAVVKQYTSYEKDTLDKIVQLRQSNINANNEYQQDSESNKLLKSILVQVENYPELKASTQFTNLQYSFNECEEQIAAGRRFLSSSITDYNNQVATFPSNIIAGMMNFQPHQWEYANSTQRQNIDATELFK